MLQIPAQRSRINAWPWARRGFGRRRMSTICFSKWTANMGRSVSFSLMTFLWIAVLLSLPQNPSISTSALENRVFQLINAERERAELKPLKRDDRLVELARQHSRDMARRGYFDHNTPEGKSPTERGRELGITCRKTFGRFYTTGIAENIFQNNLYDRVIFRNDKPTYEWNSLEDIARSTVGGWMKSDGHRKVILTDRYDRAGVGVAIAPNDQVLITQEFC